MRRPGQRGGIIDRQLSHLIRVRCGKPRSQQPEAALSVRCLKALFNAGLDETASLQEAARRAPQPTSRTAPMIYELIRRTDSVSSAPSSSALIAQLAAASHQGSRGCEDDYG